MKKNYKILRCKIDELPTKYLGMPLFMGRIKAKFWNAILGKINKKLAIWKGKLLTYDSRLLLIMNTLNSILVYSACTFKMAITIANEIDAKCRKFLLSSNSEQQRFSLIKWDKVCKENIKGGMVLRKMKLLN